MSPSDDYITITNQYGTINYYKNDQHMIEQYENQVFFEQEYILQYLSKYVLEACTIIDIGAHVGSHSIMYKAINPSAIVYCFEPQKMLYKLLCLNISNNNLYNIYSYNNAVGESVYDAQMNPYSTDGENSMRNIEYGSSNVFNLAGVQIGSGGENVKVISLDALKVNKCDFMKIDVEGYEPNVIMGAREMIRSCRPVISFEVNQKKSPNINTTTVEMLESLGYSCHRAWQDNWIALPNP